MPKRFTDTEKWKKPFLRNLKAPYKLLWFYILDECDHAGIWQVDFDVARLKIGERINEQEAIKSLGDKVVLIDGGEKWFIPSFIDFQYGKLAENNRAHTKAILALRKHGLIDGDLNVCPPSSKKNKPLVSPLTSPLQGAKEEEQEQEQEQVQEEEQAGEQGQNPPRKMFTYCVMPWDTATFREAWNRWKTYKLEQHRFQYKGSHSEQAALMSLSEISGGVEEIGLAIIKQSMANGWAGLFKLKTENDGKHKPNTTGGKQATGGNIDSQSAFSKIDALYGGT